MYGYFVYWDLLNNNIKVIQIVQFQTLNSKHTHIYLFLYISLINPLMTEWVLHLSFFTFVINKTHTFHFKIILSSFMEKIYLTETHIKQQQNNFKRMNLCWPCATFMWHSSRQVNYIATHMSPSVPLCTKKKRKKKKMQTSQC